MSDKPLLLADYKTVLDHYGINHSGLSISQLRDKVETTLANKLCKCIKKVKTSMNFATEQPSIAICSNRIFKNRNLKYYGFRCGRPRLVLPYASTTTRRKRTYRLTKQRVGSVRFKTRTVKARR